MTINVTYIVNMYSYFKCKKYYWKVLGQNFKDTLFVTSFFQNAYNRLYFYSVNGNLTNFCHIKLRGTLPKPYLTFSQGYFDRFSYFHFVT